MLQYFLRSPKLGESNLIEIPETRFDELFHASTTISTFGHITESYFGTLHAYNHLEATQFSIVQDNITIKSNFYNKSYYNRTVLISCIQSYLANSRYFIDTTARLLKKLLNTQDYTDYDQFRRSLYDSHTHYRFIEALRNYSQHRSRPLDGISLHAGMDDKSNHEVSGVAFAISLTMNKKKLEEDNKFPAVALAGLPDRINIQKSIRGHMSCIWSIYNYIYTKHVDLIGRARQCFVDASGEMMSAYSDKIIELTAVASEECNITQSVPILLEWDDARKELHDSVLSLQRLDKMYATQKLHS